MNKEHFEKFKTATYAAVEQHLAAGKKLERKVFISKVGDCACPIGCLVAPIYCKGELYPDVVSKLLNIPFSEEDMWHFIDGFDDGTEHASELYNLGVEFCRLYLGE